MPCFSVAAFIRSFYYFGQCTLVENNLEVQNVLYNILLRKKSFRKIFFTSVVAETKLDILEWFIKLNVTKFISELKEYVKDSPQVGFFTLWIAETFVVKQ